MMSVEETIWVWDSKYEKIFEKKTVRLKNIVAKIMSSTTEDIT